jgi:RNA-directed DNA polymerase
MSLTTPEKIRTLQRKLHRKAKTEPAFRFYLLYDKLHRPDILRHAYALARANAGARVWTGRASPISWRRAWKHGWQA